MPDQTPVNAEDQRAAALLEVRKQRAEIRKRRKAEMARSSAEIEKVAAQPLVRSMGTLAQPSVPLGPLGQQIGRVGGRMAIRHVIGMFVRALLRR